MSHVLNVVILGQNLPLPNFLLLHPLHFRVHPVVITHILLLVNRRQIDGDH